jgi:protein-tyrosine kinase
MSEIFDFLKKTETARRKGLIERDKSADAFVPEPITGTPVGVAGASVDGFAEEELGQAIVDPVFEELNAEESPAPETEICESGRFSIADAGYQIQNALDPLTIIGEQFRLLRSKLSLMQKQRGIKKVLITSAIPGEGKTFISCGLAGVFAQEQGKRVVLIDTDMRKPRSKRDFILGDTNGSAGIAQVLRGEFEFRNVLLMSLNPEFCFLPSGPLPPNPSELLSSPNLERALNTAAESFDWVIIDSPPVLALSDTMVIAPLCDAVLLVVRANSTPSKVVLDSIQRIGKERICGVVLNQQKRVHSSRYYYHYYHNGSDHQNR